jgi:hypothetical protein
MIGEHIRTLKGGRWNHAIDCGDETVIHLAEDGAGPSRVRRSYRPEFVAGAEVVEVVTHRARTFPDDEVVARAYSRISDPALAAMFRDSEAFASWCKTGRIPAEPPNRAIAVAPAAAPPPAAPRPKPTPKPTPTPKTRTPKTRTAKAKMKAKTRAEAKRRAKTSANAKTPKRRARRARR